MTAVVVDTSGILALLDQDHPDHDLLATLVDAEPWELVVSALVVAEADYMLTARLGMDAARRFNDDIVAGAYHLAPWSAADHSAAAAVCAQYRECVGITDAANVILAARHRTTTLMTLDQRHFRVLRPITGADAFTLLPADRRS